jgi:hypothetical protein
MGVIAWIALGVAGGLRANILLPGKRSRGLIFIGLTCFAGVLGGGWTPDYRGCRRHRTAPGGHGRVGADHHAVRAGAQLLRRPGFRVIIPQAGVLHRVSLRIGTHAAATCPPRPHPHAPARRRRQRSRRQLAARPPRNWPPARGHPRLPLSTKGEPL